MPDGWTWARLGNIGEIITGGTPSKSHHEYYGNAFPFFKPADLDQGRKTIISSEYLSEKGKSCCRIIPKFSTAVCCIGSIGKCGYLNVEGTTNQQINSVIPNIDSLYAYYYCSSDYFLEQLLSLASATTIAIVNKSKMESVLIPVPPMVEQQRIANTLDTALGLIETLEVEKSDIIVAINNVKSKILDLAIRGKLVPQDPNDEPASVLLERIREEKEELIKQGKIKRDKKESVIFKGDDNSYYEKISDEITCIDDEIPFEIPNTWEWLRLENCCSKEIRRGKSPKYTDASGTLVFAQKCNTKYAGIDIGLALYLDESTLSKYPADEYMQDGDVVINSTGTGTLGRVGLYQIADNRSCIPIVPDSHVTVIRSFSNIQSFYLYAFLKANQSNLEKKGEGSTNQKELKPITLKELLVPMPPIAEQKQISATIMRIFSIINTIEKTSAEAFFYCFDF